MDKEERDKIESALGKAPNMETLICQIGVVATDIAYELTECVAQLKRIADQREPQTITGTDYVAKEMDELLSDTPACCDEPLRTAVLKDCQLTLRQIDKLSFGEIHNICTTALESIEFKLSHLTPCKPAPDATALVDAVEKYIAFIDDPNASIGGGATHFFRKALAKYRGDA